MIEAQDFIRPAKSMGFGTWAGVPCSFLTPFINSVIDDPAMTYLSAANEGDAVAAASGAALGGRPAVAMMQNSGLGNAVSPLSSLNWVFRIPILLIVTLRGEPGLGDEPQHELMGQITGQLLDTLQIPWDWFPDAARNVADALERACGSMDRTGLPFALIMKKGTVARSGLKSHWQSGRAPQAFEPGPECSTDSLPSRRQALSRLVDQTPPDLSVVVGTTGFTGRELFAVRDRPNQLYMVGSMGCASSFGLGLSIARPDRQIVVADGDGAALMRLGNFATIGAYAGDNFHHLLLDNGVHDSTGGQSTVSRGMSFTGVARACGYRSASAATSLDALAGFPAPGTGPALLHLLTRPGVPEGLPRPDIGPRAVKRRLMDHLGIETPWKAI
jgi:phosphonopyruvate decarboxylase